MQKKKIIIAFGLLLTLFAQASVTVTLRSGQTVSGEVMLQNEEVIIIKTSTGARFQYPMADVLSVLETVESVTDTVVQPAATATSGRKASLVLRLAGGWAGAGGDIRIGANNVANKHIFIGGQVGYRALWTGGKLYHVIPITIAAVIPLMPTKHAPFIGTQIGYGIGLAGSQGGLNAGLSVGYRYQLSSTTAVQIGLYAELQQLAKAKNTIQVEDTPFTESTGRTAGLIGMECAIQF